jgi:hypothetical protein
MTDCTNSPPIISSVSNFLKPAPMRVTNIILGPRTITISRPLNRIHRIHEGCISRYRDIWSDLRPNQSCGITKESPPSSRNPVTCTSRIDGPVILRAVPHKPPLKNATSFAIKLEYATPFTLSCSGAVDRRFDPSSASSKET